MEEKILHSRIISIIYPELGINDARETEIINRNFFTRTREPSCITINEKVLESASSNEFLLIDRRLLFSKLFKIFPISRVFDSRWKFQFLNAKSHLHYIFLYYYRITLNPHDKRRKKNMLLIFDIDRCTHYSTIIEIQLLIIIIY